MQTQVDWISGFVRLNYTDQIRPGYVISINGDGEEEWATQKAVSVQGSYDSSIQLRVNDPGRSIHFSGNPVKFLQGHNIFGSNDIAGLLYDALTVVCEKLSIPPPDLEAIQNDTRLTRVDLCRNYLLDSPEQVSSFVESAGISASLKYRGSGIIKPGTVSWRSTKGSGTKIYNKGKELLAHPISAMITSPALKNWVDRILRIEHTLRARDLKNHNRALLCNWNETSADDLYSLYLSRLNLGNGMTPEKAMTELPNRLKPVYQLWKSGALMSEYYTRTTFYRHRQNILKITGDDISVTQPSEKPSNVVPLISILEAAPVGIPAFAYDEGLIHIPGKTTLTSV